MRLRNFKSDNDLRLGFTLVELAVVLVVIGLIIGGVLVGKHLITSSKLNGTIKQYQGYLMAVRAFESKYTQMPGDIEQQLATRFGLYDRTIMAADGNGDGDGNLNSCGTTGVSNTTYTRRQTCERLLFWRDLSSASLIDGDFQTAISSSAVSATFSELILYFPETKMPRPTFWLVNNHSGRNYYVLIGMTELTAGVMMQTSSSRNITPFEAYTIDKKIDDGRPTTGKVRGSAILQTDPDNTAALTTALGISGCTDSVTGSYKTTTETFANALVCLLTFSF